jgi:uncharacterized protein (TIRG00374 family)
MKWKSILQVLLGFLIGGTLFYFVIRKIEWDQFRSHLAHTRMEWGFLSMVAMLVSHWFRAQRWVLFMRSSKVHVREWDAWLALLTGYMANVFIPRIGEIARCTILFRARKTPMDVAFATVVAERVLDVIVLLLLFLFVLVVESAKLITHVSTQLRSLLPYLIGGLLTGTILFYIGIRLWRAYYRKLLRIKIIARFYRTFISFLTALKNLKYTPRPSYILFSTVMIWLLYVLSTYLMILAIPEIGSSLYFAFLVLVIGGVGFALPSPGGLGTYHWAVIFSFIMKGFTEELGSTYALISHTLLTLLSIVAGFLAYLYLEVSRTKILKA